MNGHLIALRAEFLDFHLFRMFLLISGTIVRFLTAFTTLESDKISWH